MSDAPEHNKKYFSRDFYRSELKIHLDLDVLKAASGLTSKVIPQKTAWWKKLLSMKADVVPALPALDAPDETQIKLQAEFKEASQTIKEAIGTLSNLDITMDDFNDVMSRVDTALSLDSYEVKTHPLSKAKEDVNILAKSLQKAVNVNTVIKADINAEDKVTLENMFSIAVTSVDEALQKCVVSGIDVDHQVMQIRNMKIG